MVSNIISRIFQILFFQLFPFFTYSFLLFFSVLLVHLVHTFYVNTITFAQPQYSFFSDLSLNIFLKYCFIRSALLLTVSEKCHIRKSCISSKIEQDKNYVSCKNCVFRYIPGGFSDVSKSMLV